MASGSREEWELLCAYRQQARSNDVVDLARKVGGGGMSAAAQDTLLERCIRDPVGRLTALPNDALPEAAVFRSLPAAPPEPAHDYAYPPPPVVCGWC
mmetsp:Transcript_57968/g.184073  ORF Transcript_57968/g.184073 Transcript_57968/m.184073 type:complete len:97 (-) Transcript_57968:17-307(-)